MAYEELNRDFYFDRKGFESHILRFGARLVLDAAGSEPRIDPIRKFVISYFLSDDTILVNQIPQANTGNQMAFP